MLIHYLYYYNDWGIDAEVDLAASDEAGVPLVVVVGLNRLGG